MSGEEKADRVNLILRLDQLTPEQADRIQETLRPFARFGRLSRIERKITGSGYQTHLRRKRIF